MALSEGTPVEFSDNANDISMTKYATNKALMIYDDVTAAEGRGRVVDISSGAIVLSSAQQVNGGDRMNNIDVRDISTAKCIVLYEDVTSSDIEARIIDISGTTITPGASALIEANANHPRGVATSASLGIVGYTLDGSGTHRLCRFTISGSTISPGTPQDHSVTAAQQRGIAALDSTRVVYAYIIAGNDIYVQVIDITSTISEGTAQRIGMLDSAGPIAQNGLHCMAKLDANKVIFIWKEVTATPDTISAVVITTTTGTDIDTIGTPLTIATGNNVQGGMVYAYSPTQAIIAYKDDSGNSKAETLTISGTTITSNADTITLTHEAAIGLFMDIPVLTDTKAVYGVQDDSDNKGYVSLISGVPAALSSGNARFYFGLDTLQEKFTLPWAGVAPRGMTLDKSLGTAVMGTNAPANDPVVYAAYPYPTGTSSSTGMPTGSSITSLKWI